MKHCIVVGNGNLLPSISINHNKNDVACQKDTVNNSDQRIWKYRDRQLKKLWKKEKKKRYKMKLIKRIDGWMKFTLIPINVCKQRQWKLLKSYLLLNRFNVFVVVWRMERTTQINSNCVLLWSCRSVVTQFSTWI